MLVLSRKATEAIEIGGGITVKVLEVRGGRVRLGIDAPRSIRVQRSEVTERDAVPVPSQPGRDTNPRPVAARVQQQAKLR